MELTMQRSPAPSGASSRRRAAKIALGSGTSLALAIAGITGAQAQSYNAGGTVVGGGAAITTQTNTTIITVSQPEVVINWTPSDTTGTGTIDFQSSGTTAIYQDNPTSSLAGYTVLNRILPVDATGAAASRAVAFNGTVNSTLGNATGGNIWFYSPTGIVVNGKTAFNVGSLVLTTSDIDTTGGLYGPGNTIRFTGVSDPASSVTISGGANVQVGGTSNSYLAIVSPRVNQDGNIFADGSVALVGAEAANISINAGIFDINITQGSADNRGVSHTGTTSGPATTAATDIQRIYLVAMPKNQVMTMLLSGGIGYQAAADVTVEGSSVILSSGYSHVGDRTTAAAGLGSIAIGDVAFNNTLSGDASGLLSIQPPATGNTFFGADSFLHSDTRIDMIAGPASTINANNNLTLDAGVEMKGGTINLYAGRPADSGSAAGVIFAGGTLTLNANGAPGNAAITPVNGRDGTGGNITLQADFGRVQVGSLAVNANGFGEDGSATGGNGFGGTITLSDTNNGLFLITNDTFLTADGGGGGSAGHAGSGSGGDIHVNDTLGVLSLGTFVLGAEGQGGFGGGAGAIHGDGFGGRIDLTIKGNQTWTDFIANAGAFGSGSTGLSTTAGSADADPNAIFLHVTNGGSLEVSNSFLLQADGRAGINGGANHATGGGISVLVDGGGAIFAFSGASIHARGLTDRETFTSNVNTSPDTFGGTIDVALDNGQFNTTTLDVSTRAESSGALVSAGFATGGTINISSSNGSTFTADDSGDPVNGIVIEADALAGGGASPSAAFGGYVQLTASDGAFNFLGTTNISASGRDGYFASRLSGTGFDATGGFAGILITPGVLGTGSMKFDQLNVLALGRASGPLGGTATISGNGGTGTGGSALVEVDGGTLKVGQIDSSQTVSLVIDASGFGGNSGATGSGNTRLVSGDGVGGTAQFLQTGGTASISELDVLALGLGGSGSRLASAGSDEIASDGGKGLGGNAAVTLDGGGLSLGDKLVGTVGNVVIDASGLGGNGMDNTATSNANNAGKGGDGKGGTAQLVMDPGSTAFLSAQDLLVLGDGVGGNGGGGLAGQGGNGGSGSGGQANVAVADGGFILATANLTALGIGGSGDASGGTGTGGLSQFLLVDSIAVPDKNRSLTDLSLDASGQGGSNGAGTAAASTGGNLALAADVLDPTSPLNIAGTLTATALGTNAPATGKGMTVHTSGADLTVVGAATLQTTGGIDFTSVGTAAFSAGSLDVQSGGQVTGTGLIRSLGTTSVSGLGGINLTDLNSGATTTLTATNGNIVVSHDLASAGIVNAVGTGVNITSLGALTLGTAQATAGNYIAKANGNIDATLPISATGTVGLTSTTGSVHLFGAVTANALNLNAGNAVLVDLAQTIGSGGISLTATNGVTTLGLTSGGAVTVNAGGIATLGPVQSGGGQGVSITGNLGIAAPTVISAGPTSLQSSGGTIAVTTNLSSAGSVSASGKVVTINSPGALTFAQAQATAGNLTVTTAGNLAMANGGATGALALTSTGGAISSTGTLQSGGNSAIIGAGGINLNTLQSGGTTLLQAVGGSINVTNLTSAGLVTVLGRSVTLASPGALTFTSASATAGALQVTTGGNLLVASVDATGAVTLRSTGGTLRNTGTVSGSDVTLNGSTGLTLDGNATATNALALQTGGTLAVNAIGSGRTIAATSNDIAIAGAGRLGTRGTTQTIALTNGAATGQTFVGGAGSAGLWSLSGTEIGRLFADQRITVTAGGGGDMTVGTLAVNYGTGATLGTGGEFKLNASGKVTVNGALTFNTSGASDAFSIDPTRIDVVVDTGSIAMLGANGNPQGTLNLAAGTIAVGTASTIAAINAASGTLAIQQILDQPSSVQSQTGYLRAGQINFTVGSGLYIQNSGSSIAFADRRGFTANGVSITTGSASAASAGSNPAIVINGQIIGSSGTALTGLFAAPQIQINGLAAIVPGRFDPLSSINGCIIGSSCAGGADSLAKSKPSIEGPLNPAGLNPKPVSTPLVTLADPPTLDATPLVDEPVTGVGNDDLWDGTCDERQPCRGKDKGKDKGQ